MDFYSTCMQNCTWQLVLCMILFDFRVKRLWEPGSLWLTACSAGNRWWVSCLYHNDKLHLSRYRGRDELMVLQDCDESSSFILIFFWANIVLKLDGWTKCRFNIELGIYQHLFGNRQGLVSRYRLACLQWCVTIIARLALKWSQPRHVLYSYADLISSCDHVLPNIFYLLMKLYC